MAGKSLLRSRPTCDTASAERNCNGYKRGFTIKAPVTACDNRPVTIPYHLLSRRGVSSHCTGLPLTAHFAN
jgi:hypothetical protein